MNSTRKFSTILISIQIFYLLHLLSAIHAKNEGTDNVKVKGRKLQNLPLVLMQTENSDEYSFPRCFRRYSQGKSEIVDFSTNSQNQQVVYFCPKTNAKNEKYLDPTDGKDYYCDEPPEPEIRLAATNGCGKERDLYSYGYKLFETPINDQNVSKTWKEMYSFCYDKVNKEAAYLSYRIRSPNLFGNQQLQRESSYYENEYRLGNIEDLTLKAYLATIMKYIDRKNKIPDFVTMELAHPADMVFPTWKKPLYHAINQGLLIPELKKQWRKIGRHLRDLAQKKLGEIDIITGTFPYPGVNGPLFGTWWKLVIYKNRAIAIILHNRFIPRAQKEKKPKRKNKRNKKGKKGKKGKKVDAENQVSGINNEMIENKINAEEKTPTGKASTTTTNDLDIKPTQSDTEVAIKSPKNIANINGSNLPSSNTNFNKDPLKIRTDANSNPLTDATNTIGKSSPGNKINSGGKKSKGQASIKTTNDIDIKPTQSNTELVVDSSKNNANVNGINLAGNDLNLNGEPLEIGTDVNGNPATGESPPKYETLCKDICHEMGFHHLGNIELEVHAYCCAPEIITKQLGLPDYELLNLNAVLENDASVLNDECPKDPIKPLKSDDEKTFANLNTAPKS
ncbi:uncharacterized protein LOC135848752 [Planococcus citri]|uniref:uncharacterized protein LOC135848752 n=1 Tax=Planococcus citri TaxID=170843 RepID=UPI0031F76F45